MSFLKKPLILCNPEYFEGNPEGYYGRVAYGLEMQIDDEWPLELVLTISPLYAKAIADYVNLEEMAIARIACEGLPMDNAGTPDFTGMTPPYRDWLLYPKDDSHTLEQIRVNVESATRHGVNVVLNLPAMRSADPSATCLNILRGMPNECLKYLIVCHRPQDDAGQLLAAEACKAATAGLRAALAKVVDVPATVSQMRFILWANEAEVTQKNVKAYVDCEQVDGVAYFNCHFDGALGAMFGLMDAKSFYQMMLEAEKKNNTAEGMDSDGHRSHHDPS